jgi:hypothetical protein
MWPVLFYGKELGVRTLTRILLGVATLLGSGSMLLAAESKGKGVSEANEMLSKKIADAAGSGTLLPTLAVIGASLVVALAMIRRTRRG